MEILQQLLQFQEQNGRIYDLNFSGPSPAAKEKLMEPIPEKVQYNKIAQHYSGSLIVIHIQKNSIKWIDANGSPNAVIANSLQDFISLLPYGTGLLYDALYLIEKHKGKKELAEYLLEDFPEQVWKNALQNNAKSVANHAQFLKLMEILKIEITPKPLEMLMAANA